MDATKICNILVICAYVVGIANNLLTSTLKSALAISLVHIAVFIIPALLVISAVKGAEKWKTLI